MGRIRSQEERSITDFHGNYGWRTTTKAKPAKPKGKGSGFTSHDGVAHGQASRGRRGTFFGTFSPADGSALEPIEYTRACGAHP